MSRPIDVMHLGRDRVICAYERDAVIVDPGPASCADTLVKALCEVEPRALLLTHIHLDHAGAAGVLCRRFPELLVYVHESGAPHLIDPSKLLRSAARLYGDDMDRLWGEVAPVDAARVRPLAGGELVEGFRVAYTPGHASHHVCYLDEGSGEAYAGDVAGVRVPPNELTLAPTPPPDIDLERWADSLATLADWRPTRLCLTHFGAYPDVADQIERQRAALERQSELARGVGEEKFVAALREWLREGTDPESAASYEQAAPPDQLYQGLERYWRKRAEAEVA